jgi:hypothetical protein
MSFATMQINPAKQPAVPQVGSKLLAFNEKQERHRTLYIGEASACFKIRDKDSLMHEWDTNRYYLTGFVDGVLEMCNYF